MQTTTITKEEYEAQCEAMAPYTGGMALGLAWKLLNGQFKTKRARREARRLYRKASRFSNKLNKRR